LARWVGTEAVRQVGCGAREDDDPRVVPVLCSSVCGTAEPTRCLTNVPLRFERTRRFEREHQLVRIGRIALGGKQSLGESLSVDACHHRRLPILLRRILRRAPPAFAIAGSKTRRSKTVAKGNAVLIFDEDRNDRSLRRRGAATARNIEM
jgi:hypothetical protein